MDARLPPAALLAPSDGDEWGIAMSVTTFPGPALTSAAQVPASKPCPLCSHGESDVHQCIEVARGPAAGKYALRRCRACELIYLDPRLPDSILAKLYGDDFYFSTGHALANIAELVLHRIQCARQGRVERHTRRGSLLDVGSGDGRFVAHMADRGWKATGLDFSPAAQVLAESRGSEGRFVCGSIFDAQFEPESFDVITMWQVLEHIGEPCAFLERAHRLLRRGGTFLAAVPNIESVSARIAGERWWGLDVPRHLVHYSPRTLRLGLVRAGFMVKHIHHLSLQYDPYGLMHSALDWLFTRRHFLSDFAKHQVPADIGRGEFAWNVAALTLLGPLIAPASVVTTVGAACARQGGFIEVYAKRC